MKNFYPFQSTDLRHRVDHITPTKIQLFHQFSEDSNYERFFLILLRHRQDKKISDGNKIFEVKTI